MKKKIAIIGANEPLREFFIQTKQLGYEIHCFAWEEGSVCKKFSDYFYPISYKEKKEILKICKKIKINGITSFSLESALPTVNFIAREMGLEAQSEECERNTANKYVMREQLKKADISVPAFVLVETENELTQMELKFPVIVKPIDSGGSRGVTLANSPAELKSAYKRAKTFSKAGKVLIEQYIEGREFSVEYISYGGKHYFVAITDKVTTGSPYFVELEHHQPANISAEIQNAIKGNTRKTLETLEINSGASHTELKMDKNGNFFIIEVGPRMGGDMITSDLVRLSTGYNFVKGVLELISGDFQVPEFTSSQCSGIYFLSKENLKVYDFILNSNNYPDIAKTEIYKNDITNIKESNDRAGYFIYQGDKKFFLTDTKLNIPIT